MSAFSEELVQISEELTEFIEKFDKPEIQNPVDKLEDAAVLIGKAWSGSWLGYHSCVYYEDFNPPPPGAHFSLEWGMMDSSFVRGTAGAWKEYDYDHVQSVILKTAGNPNVSSAKKISETASSVFDDKKEEVLSILTTCIGKSEDPFLEKLKGETDKIKLLHYSDYVLHFRPSGEFMSRDQIAVGQGFKTPPHYHTLCEVMGVRQPIQACKSLKKRAKRANAHLSKQEKRSKGLDKTETNIFIGHGRSNIWKDLKDFIHDRIGLPWDEFNRIPVAGITNIARLSEMLDDAAIAFLVMTAEDEQADGKIQARMNVVHEAGLFQGRLGFTKSILLIEEGCEEFSNIQGLGQIRFPKGNIKAVFEDVRKVLEREGLIET